MQCSPLSQKENETLRYVAKAKRITETETWRQNIDRFRFRLQQKEIQRGVVHLLTR